MRRAIEILSVNFYQQINSLTNKTSLRVESKLNKNPLPPFNQQVNKFRSLGKKMDCESNYTRNFIYAMISIRYFCANNLLIKTKILELMKNK
jgi:hypothetical protein